MTLWMDGWRVEPQESSLRMNFRWHGLQMLWYTSTTSMMQHLQRWSVRPPRNWNSHLMCSRRRSPSTGQHFILHHLWMNYAGVNHLKSHQLWCISSHCIFSVHFTIQSWRNAHAAQRTSNGKVGQLLAIVRCMGSRVTRPRLECSWGATPARQHRRAMAMMKKRCNRHSRWQTSSTGRINTTGRCRVSFGLVRLRELKLTFRIRWFAPLLLTCCSDMQPLWSDCGTLPIVDVWRACRKHQM